METVQACYFKDKENAELSKEMLKWFADVPLESVVDIEGELVEANVRSCTTTNVEMQIKRMYVVTRAPKILPFLVEDAGRSDADIAASQSSDKPFASVPQDARLDNRWLDVRVPAHAAIFRIQAAVSRLFRSSLDDLGFLEIHSPKLIAGESESGAGVFKTDYFGETACLAQSPQLYKQMAIAGDMDRVYEVGPVFRAENSNTRRHLCEFTGLDFEMAVTAHYSEAIDVAHEVFKKIFAGLEEKHSKELGLVRTQYASEAPVISEQPVVIHFTDAAALVRSDGDLSDFSGAEELKIGELVKLSHGVDFIVIDQYPAALRPFYTMPNPADPALTNSYDFLLRGQEICSGAQRCHDPAVLKKVLEAKGVTEVTSPSLLSYVTALEHGAPPHAGCGFGLERVVFLYLGLDNIRKASLFPRDPRRCAP
mmetsp:Transcript_26189/g.93452  ORF Transcript_26189/g.93452 Transcript_26189/m.93452 type:complete len:424 (-) Transcript_26189:17-1288(-)